MIRAARQRNLRRMAGFTLMELMITVAIVGILAAIAYPAYTNAVLKGKRAQGRAALLELLTQQERYFTQYNTYLAFGAGAAGNTGTDASNTSTVEVKFKTFSGDSPTAPAYKLGARTCTSGASATELRSCVQVYATNQFSDAAAGELNITSTGVKSCNGTNASVCW